MTDRIDEIRARCHIAAEIINKSFYGKVDYDNDYMPVITSLKDTPYLLERLAEAEHQRDAAVKDMTDMANEIESTETCEWCKWYGDDGCQRPGEETRDCFEWRGKDI